MRTTLAATALLAAVCASSPATAQEYPWCADYSEDVGGVNCGFVSWQQCMWTVSGVGGHCRENGFYRGPATRPRTASARERKPKRQPDR